jgi:FtsP/CotA-like multicopper oxidase with cupredoxin domain
MHQARLAQSDRIWEVRNATGTPHNFHVHGVSFRVLGEDGPAARKDTLYVPPDATARLLTRFGGYRDPRTPYVFHCHVLRHEDDGGLTLRYAPGQRRHFGHRPTVAAGRFPAAA